MLFFTFLFLYQVVNVQKYIIITLTNARAIHSHSPLLSPVKPLTSRLLARFLNLRMIAVHLYISPPSTLFCKNFSVIDFKVLLHLSVGLYKIHKMHHLPYIRFIYFLFGNSLKTNVGVRLLCGKLKLFQNNA